VTASRTASSSPCTGATRCDGLPDGDEVNLHGTDPTAVDTDGDGLSDPDELFVHGTNPLVADSDGDGASDGYEIAQGTDPNDPLSFPSPAVPALGPAGLGTLVALLGLAGFALGRRRRE
jgi:hypothetical protein